MTYNNPPPAYPSSSYLLCLVLRQIYRHLTTLPSCRRVIAQMSLFKTVVMYYLASRDHNSLDYVFQFLKTAVVWDELFEYAYALRVPCPRSTTSAATLAPV